MERAEEGRAGRQPSSHNGSALTMPDITSPTFKADPSPTTHNSVASPQHEVMLPGRHDPLLVTRSANMPALLKDERFVKSRANVVAPGKSYRGSWLPAMFRRLSRNMRD